MGVGIKALMAAGLIFGGSLGAGALGCEVAGEAWRPDKPGKPYEALTSTQYYSNCAECQAAIEDTYAKYPGYYRNLQCVNCDCGQSEGNDNATTSQSSPDPSANDQAAQQAADEKEREANLAKEQKFKEDKQDALSQLKGVSGDSDEAADEKGVEPVSKQLNGPRERAVSISGGGFDRASGRAKPKELNIPPASPPVREEPLVTLEKQIKQYQTDLEKKKKKIQELNRKITQLAVKLNETSAPEVESAPATPPPGAPEAKPTPAPKADDSAAKKLAELNALRQAAMADQADLEKKISDSEKQADEMSKPTPIP